MNPLLLQVLFLALPLGLFAVMWAGFRVAVRHGWIVERREPTEYELAVERARKEIQALADAMAEAFLPVLEKVRVTMVEFTEAMQKLKPR